MLLKQQTGINYENIEELWLPLDRNAGTMVPSKDDDSADALCRDLSKLFYIRTSCNSVVLSQEQKTQQLSLMLTQGLEWLQDFPDDIVATVWRHDADLGRGFLLVSSGNRVWRWERGGGPIPIGRSLQLDHAGCRPDRIEWCASRNGGDNHRGVGGLSLDFLGVESTFGGSLVLAEWGEGRIVRLEDNGARTPLAVLPGCEGRHPNQPDSTAGITFTKQQSVLPQHLLMTPFGDLLFMQSNTSCTSSASSASIYMVRQAMQLPVLESLAESRLAHNHSWIQQHLGLKQPILFWNSDDDPTTGMNYQLGGMALTTSWTSLYVSMTQQSNTDSSSSAATAALLYQVPLTENDEEDDDEDIPDQRNKKPLRSRSELIWNLTQTVPSWTNAGPLVVTKQGFVFWVVEETLLVVMDLSSSTTTRAKRKLLGYFRLADRVTSLSLGGTEDSFLYITTSQSLWRLSTRHGMAHPVVVPTNLAPTHRQSRQE